MTQVLLSDHHEQPVKLELPEKQKNNQMPMIVLKRNAVIHCPQVLDCKTNSQEFKFVFRQISTAQNISSPENTPSLSS